MTEENGKARKETADEKFDRQLSTFRENQRRYRDTPESERRVWLDPKYLGGVVGFEVMGLDPSDAAEEKDPENV